MTNIEPKYALEQEVYILAFNESNTQARPYKGVIDAIRTYESFPGKVYYTYDVAYQDSTCTRHLKISIDDKYIYATKEDIIKDLP